MALLPNVTGEVTGLRWYLPVRSPQDRNVEGQADAGVTNANWSLMRDTALQVDKIAHRYVVESGDGSDPEAAPNLGFGQRSFELDGNGRGSFPLGEGRSLAFNAANATIELVQDALRTIVWGGEAVRQPGERDSFRIDDTCRLTVETAASASHANAVTPSQITIESGDQSVTLRPAE